MDKFNFEYMLRRISILCPTFLIPRISAKREENNEASFYKIFTEWVDFKQLEKSEVGQ